MSQSFRAFLRCQDYSNFCIIKILVTTVKIFAFVFSGRLVALAT